MKNQALSRHYRIGGTFCAATVLLALIMCLGSTAKAQSTNGSAGQMPAYYDGHLLTINLMLLPAGTVVLSKNTQINLKMTPSRQKDTESLSGKHQWQLSQASGREAIFSL